MESLSKSAPRLSFAASPLAGGDSFDDGSGDDGAPLFLAAAVRHSMIEAGLSQAEIVAFLEEYGRHKRRVEDLEAEVAEQRAEVAELRLRASTGGSSNRLDEMSASDLADSMIEAGLSQAEIVAFFEEFGRHKRRVEDLEAEVAEHRAEVAELRLRAKTGSNGGGSGMNSIDELSAGDGSSIGGSGMNSIDGMSVRGGSSIGGLGMNRMDEMSASQLLAEHSPPRTTSRKSAVGASRSRRTKGRSRSKVLHQSCRTLSMQRILNDPDGNEDTERVLRELIEMERRQKKLEKQLRSAGVSIAEDIPYEEAKGKVTEIAKRMGEIGSPEVEHDDKLVQAKLREEYFRLEQDMEKYSTAAFPWLLDLGWILPRRLPGRWCAMISCSEIPAAGY